MYKPEKTSDPKNQERPKIIGGAEDSYFKVRESWDKDRLALIERQLETEMIVEVKDHDGRPIKIEGRFLNANPQSTEPKQTLAIIPGWSSSFASSADFAKHIALNGDRPVVIISLPGTGKSDNAPKAWLQEKSFYNEGFAAMQAIRQIRNINGDLGGKEISVLGHSMGGMVAAEAAKQSPDEVKTLILAHSAGVEKESEIALSTRFTANFIKESAGNLKNWAKSGFDKEWRRQVIKGLGVAGEIGKNVFTDKEKLMQHLIRKEVNVLANGEISKTLKGFKGNLIIMSGTGEHLFLPGQSDRLKLAATEAISVEIIISNMSKHHDLQVCADQEAILIAHQLDKLEEKN